MLITKKIYNPEILRSKMNLVKMSNGDPKVVNEKWKF